MNKPLSPATPANALLLQKEVTKRLQDELDLLNNTYFQMSQMRNRSDLKNHADFVRRHKELFIQSIHLEADLHRSQAKEKLLEAQQAAA
jgi:GTPase SAR1 family protein